MRLRDLNQYFIGVDVADHAADTTVVDQDSLTGVNVCKNLWQSTGNAGWAQQLAAVIELSRAAGNWLAR